MSYKIRRLARVLVSSGAMDLKLTTGFDFVLLERTCSSLVSSNTLPHEARKRSLWIVLFISASREQLEGQTSDRRPTIRRTLISANCWIELSVLCQLSEVYTLRLVASPAVG